MKFKLFKIQKNKTKIPLIIESNINKMVAPKLPRKVFFRSIPFGIPNKVLIGLY